MVWESKWPIAIRLQPRVEPDVGGGDLRRLRRFFGGHVFARWLHLAVGAYDGGRARAGLADRRRSAHFFALGIAPGARSIEELAFSVAYLHPSGVRRVLRRLYPRPRFPRPASPLPLPLAAHPNRRARGPSRNEFDSGRRCGIVDFDECARGLLRVAGGGNRRTTGQDQGSGHEQPDRRHGERNLSTCNELASRFAVAFPRRRLSLVENARLGGRSGASFVWPTHCFCE